MKIKNIFGGFALSSILLTTIACSNDEIQEDSLLSQDNLELPDSSVNRLLSARTNSICGQDANRESLGNNSPQGPENRCNRSTLGASDGNPGLLDCRVNRRGQHIVENGWYVYSISQGNKTNTNTAVRIERGFTNFRNPGAGKEVRAQFDGRVRIVNLPSDYTYICQMHGSGQVTGGARSGSTHTSAIWLLRAQRISNTQFRFRIEISNGAITNTGRPSPARTAFDIGGDHNIGGEFRVRVNFGYTNGQYAGTIRINDEPFFNVITGGQGYDFTTAAQYFRYGAYRAGANTDPTGALLPQGQARIEWQDGVEFCNGPETDI